MASITQFKIRRPDDFHVHLREGEMLEAVLPHTAKVFGRALVMPNLKTPVRIGVNARHYEEQIRRLSEKTGFEPLMTIKLTQDTDARMISAAASAQVAAVKLYPEGVTTNSENGVRDITKLHDTFKAMVDNRMVLCVHAEQPGVFSMERELYYLRNVAAIASKHPDLKIVIEHATMAETLKFVEEAGPNMAATITVHHLFITLDDVVGDKLNPHNFCKPIAKRPEDRAALIAAALSGKPQFFLGTDSAPHMKETKECSAGCAGCFTAPIAMPLLAELFDKHDSLASLELFASTNGAKFYGLQPNSDFITLERAPGEVPLRYSNDKVHVVPFMAGEKLSWRVA